MTDYNPPHEVRDKEKLQSMIDTLNRGGQLPPVIVCGDNAITGSHRIAAWESCNMKPQVVEISDREYLIAKAIMYDVDDFDPDNKEDVEFITKYYGGFEIVDYNDLCKALLKTTTSIDIKNAVKDQVD